MYLCPYWREKNPLEALQGSALEFQRGIARLATSRRFNNASGSPLPFAETQISDASDESKRSSVNRSRLGME
jgi:hypothetical protein